MLAGESLFFGSLPNFSKPTYLPLRMKNEWSYYCHGPPKLPATLIPQELSDARTPAFAPTACLSLASENKAVSLATLSQKGRTSLNFVRPCQSQHSATSFVDKIFKEDDFNSLETASTRRFIDNAAHSITTESKSVQFIDCDLIEGVKTSKCSTAVQVNNDKQYIDAEVTTDDNSTLDDIEALRLRMVQLRGMCALCDQHVRRTNSHLARLHSLHDAIQTLAQPNANNRIPNSEHVIGSYY